MYHVKKVLKPKVAARKWLIMAKKLIATIQVFFLLISSKPGLYTSIVSKLWYLGIRVLILHAFSILSYCLCIITSLWACFIPYLEDIQTFDNICRQGWYKQWTQGPRTRGDPLVSSNLWNYTLVSTYTFCVVVYYIPLLQSWPTAL